VDGDIIIRADQIEVRDAEDLIKHLRERKIGEVVNLRVIRDGKTLDIKVTLQERPRNFRRPNEKSR
jgi:S1-C subfamily serine protease